MSVRTHPHTFKTREDEFEPFDSFSGGTLDLDPNDWNKVYTMDIEDGNGVLFGRGETENPLQAEGYLGATMCDADGNILTDGRYRITVRTASGALVDTLAEGDLAQIVSREADGTAKEKSDRDEFRRRGNEFTTKEYLVHFEVQPDAAETVADDPTGNETEILADGHRAERVA